MKKTYLIHNVTCAKCVASIEKILSPTIEAFTIVQSPGLLKLSGQSVVTPETINHLLQDTKYRVEEANKVDIVFSYLKLFRPLIIMISLVIAFAAFHWWLYDYDYHVAMETFMAGYFLLFGALKVANWKNFVVSYSKYDLLAKEIPGFAWLYPALEVGIGFVYYAGVWLTPVNVVVALLMLLKAYSVNEKLRQGDTTKCACLGGFFNVPITRVTFFEDILMAVMAILMLFPFFHS